MARILDRRVDSHFYSTETDNVGKPYFRKTKSGAGIGLLVFSSCLNLEFQASAFAASPAPVASPQPPLKAPTPLPKATEQKPKTPVQSSATVKPTSQPASKTQAVEVFWAKVYRGSTATKRINQLKVTNAPQDGSFVKLISVKDQKGETSWGVELTLQYDSALSTLTFPKKGPVYRKVSAKPVVYQIWIPVHQASERLPLISVSPMGTAETEELLIQVPQWDKIFMAKPAEKTPAGQPPGTEQKFLGFGYTSIAYQETGIDPVKAAALTLKGGYTGDLRRLLKGGNQPSVWNWGVGAYYTALPLSSTRPDVKLRYLGVNVRVGYLLPRPESPWSLRLSTGYFYTTTLTSAIDPLNNFGFQGQMGPQLQALLARGFKGGHQISTYVKLALLSEGFSSISPASRELAVGFSYSKMLSSRLALVAGVDLSWLKTSIVGTVGESTYVSEIHSDTSSFSLGLMLM